MRILLAGGVYRLTPEARAGLRPAPEEVLEAGLRAAGEDVDAIPLKDFRRGLLPGGYDIVHVHHMSKMSVLQAVLPRPMVFTHHASTFATTPVQRVAERVVWTRSDGVVCLSEKERRDKVARFPWLTARITVIPNGIPPLGSGPGHAPALRRWAPGDDFVIAMVGQLLDVKRPHLAVRALGALPDHVRLELTYHNDRLEAELRALARDVGVSARVSFLGQAGGEELHERYARAHVLLMTSYAEALPSVVSEALVTGCPVIATDVGGIREQVGGAGILVDRDAAGYASAVESAMSGYDALARAAFERGRVLADEYSPEAMARKHVDFYRRVLERA